MVHENIELPTNLLHISCLEQHLSITYAVFNRLQPQWSINHHLFDITDSDKIEEILGSLASPQLMFVWIDRPYDSVALFASGGFTDSPRHGTTRHAFSKTFNCNFQSDIFPRYCTPPTWLSQQHQIPSLLFSIQTTILQPSAARTNPNAWVSTHGPVATYGLHWPSSRASRLILPLSRSFDLMAHRHTLQLDCIFLWHHISGQPFTFLN